MHVAAAADAQAELVIKAPKNLINANILNLQA
jgi:hypothetical protein